MAEDSLTDLLYRVSQNTVAGLHSALPGKVLSYDRGRRLADVQPLLRRPYPDGRALDPPVIAGVPIIMPSAASAFMIDFPLKKGDPLLLIILDWSIDEWLTTGKLETPKDLEPHPLRSCIGIPGLYAPVAFDAFSRLSLTNDAVIAYNGTTIRIAETGGVVIHGDLHVQGGLKVDNPGTFEQGVVSLQDVTAFNGEHRLSFHTHSGVQPGSGASGPPIVE